MRLLPKVTAFPSHAVKITSNKTIADPSFTSDSPSIKVESVLDAPNSFSKETTATGSVAPKIDPNKKESLNLNPSFYKILIDY